MLQTFLNIFRVPELRNKVLFTLLMLAIYRIGYHIPLPGVDQQQFAEIIRNQSQDSAAARLGSYLSLFSGGTLQQSTIFGLGVMPYISASIIFQLLATVVPALEKLKKEGQSGQRKIQEWTRYATVPIAMIQGAFWLGFLADPQNQLVLPGFSTSFWILGMLALTAGTIFLMWLGEQIDEYGLGNGISLIILAGIVAQMPGAIYMLISRFGLDPSDATRDIGIGDMITLLVCFLFVTAGAIAITQAQRRIPIQQAKHTRGRKVYGGTRQYLPLRVNHGGVMPIIFAQSLMLFPGVIFGALNSGVNAGGPPEGFFGNLILFLNQQFGNYGGYLYTITEVGLIFFFSYFWTTVQFQPKEMANQLRDYGSFVPGLRPGKRTAEYLEKVMYRITFVGAAFLSFIAIVPMTVTSMLGIPFQITAFLGGTGLLIVVSVALDAVQRIEANLLMRNFSGFLAGDPKVKSKRIRGRQY
jgi:preprotein translocase subunit SecY